MNRDRAEAHYRWAGRYTKRGNTSKAIAHFGRACEIEEQRADGQVGRGQAGFGGGGAAPRASDTPDLDEKRAHDAQVCLGHVKAAMPDLAENRAQDAQILFGYVRAAFVDLGGSDEGDPRPATVNGMSIWFNKRTMQVFVEVQDVTEESARFEMDIRTGHSLRNMGLALDECAKKLQDRRIIDAEKRLFLQRDVMAYAHIIHLRSTQRFR